MFDHAFLYIFTIISGIIALAVEGRYIYSIITRQTIPSFSGWFIISLSMSIIFFSSLSAGAGHSIYLIGLLALLHMVEAFLALKFGIFKITHFEILFVILSFVGLSLWLSMDNPLYALLINIAIDSIGMTAIAYKLFRFPGTEDKYAWGASVLMYGVNILAVQNWTIQDALFISINFFTCSVIFFLSLRKITLLRRFQIFFATFLHIRI